MRRSPFPKTQILFRGHVRFQRKSLLICWWSLTCHDQKISRRRQFFHIPWLLLSPQSSSGNIQVCPPHENSSSSSEDVSSCVLWSHVLLWISYLFVPGFRLLLFVGNLCFFSLSGSFLVDGLCLTCIPITQIYTC